MFDLINVSKPFIRETKRHILSLYYYVLGLLLDVRLLTLFQGMDCD